MCKDVVGDAGTRMSSRTLGKQCLCLWFGASTIGINLEVFKVKPWSIVVYEVILWLDEEERCTFCILNEQRNTNSNWSRYSYITRFLVDICVIFLSLVKLYTNVANQEQIMQRRAYGQLLLICSNCSHEWYPQCYFQHSPWDIPLSVESFCGRFSLHWWTSCHCSG